MIKNTLIAALVAALLTAGAFAYLKPQQQPNEKKVGALAGPEIPFSYLSWGGVTTYGANTMSLQTATNTVCALQAPAATSTLRMAALRESVSSTTASRIWFGKGATKYSSSTAYLWDESVSANAQITSVVPATTTLAGSQAYTFAPNTWLVVSQVGGTGTMSPSGACEAQWTAI